MSDASVSITQQFKNLQTKLVDMWQEIGSTISTAVDQPATIVVVPSLSTDMPMLSSVQQGYEERLLFMLFLLRKPALNLIYVTSLKIQPEIIEYYLELLPGVVSHSARKRLFLVSPEDGSSKPLSQKLLDRPHLLRHIRSLIPDMNQAHMVPFNTTHLERQVAVQLGIPMYGVDPRFIDFGTKSGGRRVFTEEGIPHPLGYEDLFSVEAVVKAIRRLRAQRPTVKKAVLKLNEGVSGIGNAMLNLADLPAPGAPDEAEAITQRVYAMGLESDMVTVETYLNTLASKGAIVEEFVSGAEVRSPSAQLRISPLGEVEMLSTHDQMLGGPSGQSYLGAIFPADTAYGWQIMADAVKVARRFAREGIIGRFALDFVVVKNAQGTWDSYAIEVNLRKGGTTAPFLILQYLTDGHFDVEKGIFLSSQGQPKYYIASDHLESPAYRAFTVDQLFDIVSRHRLHFNHATQTGVVMHMLTGVSELGRVGVTAIADSREEAKFLYERFIAVLDSEAAKLR